MQKGDYNKLHSKLKIVAEKTPGIHKAGMPVMDNVNGLGKQCWRELAFRLYDLAEQQGIIDRCFPVSAVKEDE